MINSPLQYQIRIVFRSWLRILGSRAWLNGYSWLSGNWNTKNVFLVSFLHALDYYPGFAFGLAIRLSAVPITEYTRDHGGASSPNRGFLLRGSYAANADISLISHTNQEKQAP